MIPLRNFCGCVKAVVGKEVEDVEGVEHHAGGPIGNDWKCEREILVRKAGDERRLRSDGVFRERREGRGGVECGHSRRWSGVITRYICVLSANGRGSEGTVDRCRPRARSKYLPLSTRSGECCRNLVKDRLGQDEAR